MLWDELLTGGDLQPQLLRSDISSKQRDRPMHREDGRQLLRRVQAGVWEWGEQHLRGQQRDILTSEL